MQSSELRLLAEHQDGEAEWYVENRDDHEHYSADEMMEFHAERVKAAAIMRAAADRIDFLERELERHCVRVEQIIHERA